MKTNGKKNTKVILLMAYGCPNRPDDILPYYTDVRRGRPPEEHLLQELEERYKAIGSKTPLLRITLQQAKKLEERLGVKTFVGMKHWSPYIKDAVLDIAQYGAKEIVALALTPQYSRMSVGDYKNRLQTAIEEIDPGLRITLIERWGDNPLYIDSLAKRIDANIKQLQDPSYNAVEVIFTAHSLPIRILSSGDPYYEELLFTASLVANKLNLPNWRLAFQSAGRTGDAWLGPDILEELTKLSLTRTKQVVVAPIGFVADNLEILYDLDIQAAEIAKDLGLVFKRIPTANATSRFIDALEDVVRPYLASPQRAEYIPAVVNQGS